MPLRADRLAVRDTQFHIRALAQQEGDKLPMALLHRHLQRHFRILIARIEIGARSLSK